MQRESEFWNTLYSNTGAAAQSPHTRALHEAIKGLIADDVRTVLDAGCGGGALMAFLAPEGKYEIQGVDQSEEGVASVVDNLKMRADVGDLTDLHQFADDTFDLVVCSKVTEHMGRAALTPCFKELFRVSKKYVITTNPFDEELSYHLMVCDSCRTRFHPAGHINRVDEEFVRRQMEPHARSIDFHYSGKRVWRSPGYASLMRSWGYSVLILADQMCPVCGNKVSQKKRGIGVKLTDRVYSTVQRGWTSLGFWDHANIIAVAQKRG